MIFFHRFHIYNRWDFYLFKNNIKNYFVIYNNGYRFVKIHIRNTWHLERLYKDTEIVHYSIDDYLNLPVNDEYKKNQEKKKKLEKEKEKKLTDEKSQWF